MEAVIDTMKRQDYHKAHTLLQQALHDPHPTQHLQLTLTAADVAFRLHDLNAALNHYDVALDLVTRKHDVLQEAAICVGKSYVLMTMKMPDLALISLRRALEIAEEQRQQAQIKFIQKLIMQSESNKQFVGSDVTAAAFVDGLLEKNTILLVHEDNAENTTAIRNTFAESLIQYASYSVSNDTSIRNAFITAAQRSYFPLLFVKGKLIGDSFTMREMTEDVERFKNELAARLSPEELKIASHDCGDSCSHEDHRHMLSQTVERVVRRIVPEGDLIVNFRDNWRNVIREDQTDVLIDELAVELGGFSIVKKDFCETNTFDEIVDYIEANCEADGDCSKCPLQTNCKAHSDQVLDIEDILSCPSQN